VRRHKVFHLSAPGPSTVALNSAQAPGLSFARVLQHERDTWTAPLRWIRAKKVFSANIMNNIVSSATASSPCPASKALAKHPDFRVTCGSSPAGQPIGRHQNPDVALVTEESRRRHGHPVSQPESLRMDPGRAPAPGLRRKPTPTFVASYGKILPKEYLGVARLGCLNVSRLPPAEIPQGASPISAPSPPARPRPGITIMLMDEGLDTGPTLSTQEPASRTKTRRPTLTTRARDVGAELVATTLKAWLAGEIKSVPQPNDG